VFVQDFVSGLACCVNKSRLVVILVHTIGSTWYKVLYHHTMYVMGIYLSNTLSNFISFLILWNGHFWQKCLFLNFIYILFILFSNNLSWTCNNNYLTCLIEHYLVKYRIKSFVKVGTDIIASLASGNVCWDLQSWGYCFYATLH
jgi:hypothetical protein